jgi:hypothetical protein
MVEEPILYLLAYSLIKFVEWEWVSDGYRLSFEVDKIPVGEGLGSEASWLRYHFTLGIRFVGWEWVSDAYRLSFEVD